nr:uncharacterized protein LOC123759416 isoform X1 [Procambarus clarkii]XP_045600423.1 uncharacterized protein LOC123759416 isoform X1 [Procambarus clarkii]XP_045600424.1 uncharacterized protein LOC123759416 isoform X1 [Procambarus clarkii]XP_045600425.1 uncharacterized protein LOC123759416 isoform X1 [Procambarus clarkii]
MEDKVVIRRARLGDAESVLEVCRAVQAEMARQEARTQLLHLLTHPYLVGLTLFTFLTIHYTLQTSVAWSAVMGCWVVALVEAARYWLFWGRIRRVFQPGPDLLNLVHYYSHPRRLFLVAEVGEAVAGTIALRETVDPDTAKLWRMFVHPRFRRRSIASRLISACNKEARLLGYRAVELRTHLTNQAALRCYHKAGYITLRQENFARLYPYTFDTVHCIWRNAD